MTLQLGDTAPDFEAETTEGTFKFASMSDFKRHLSETKAKTASATE